MAKFVSQSNPVSMHALKRKPVGNVVLLHGGREDVRFTRVVGGWLRSRVDVTSEHPELVSSSDVANECNTVMGCKESWAKVYQLKTPTV